jgi:hypothetical protein
MRPKNLPADMVSAPAIAIKRSVEMLGPALHGGATLR